MPLASVRPARHRRLSCVGFDARATASMQAALALIAGRSLDHWEYVEDLGADVVVYQADSALGRALARQAAALSRPQAWFVSGAADDSCDLPFPFAAVRLLRCLDHASQRLPADAPPRTGDSLCERLDALLQTPGLAGVELSLGDCSGYLSFTQRRLFWPRPFGMDELAGLLTGDVKLRPVGAGDRDLLRRLQAHCGNPVDSQALLWRIATATSGGRLLSRLDPDRPYRLVGWPPEMESTGSRSSELHCAALMAGKVLSPAHLAVASGVPAAQVNGFINACALCGLLEVPTERSAARPDKTGGLVRRLRAALALPG